jgi:arylsulfatase
MLPMLLTAAGVTLPQDLAIDGRDPISTLAGKTPSQHEFLFFEYRNWSGVRSGRWKIVRGDPNSDFELYDLRTDWSETNNLAAEKPKIRNALAKAFDDWRNNVQP